MNITQCMQPNFLLTGRVYPMLMPIVPQAWGSHNRNNTLFKLIVKFFQKGVIFMFWHDILYVQLLYCVTNVEFVWTWNKAALVENAKKCRLYSTFLFLHFSLKIFGLNISTTRANLKKLSAYSGSALSIYPKIDFTLRAKIFCWPVFWF